METQSPPPVVIPENNARDLAYNKLMRSKLEMEKKHEKEVERLQKTVQLLERNNFLTEEVHRLEGLIRFSTSD